jgi:hypothetical protein
MQRIRDELIHLNGLGEHGADIVFAPSGTDLHLFVPQLLGGRGNLTAIAVETAETGSGVHLAASGSHFSDRSAFAAAHAKASFRDGGHAVRVVTVACRNEDGTPRPLAQMDREVESLAENIVKADGSVLIALTDLSKSGLIAPGISCVCALKDRFSEQIDILVDACQFRISPATLRAYLARDFIVAVTGSKFVAGPAFSAALIVSKHLGRRLSSHSLPPRLNAYSAKGDWPEGWAARNALSDGSNFGLLLRWEAALAHMRAFHALAEKDVRAFITSFAASISKRLAEDPAFEPLPAHSLDRAPLVEGKSWDSIPTIFPFLLRTDAGYLNREETARIHEQLKEGLFHLGQPVACGTRGNIPISALRICLDMRLIADGVSNRGEKAVISDAFTILDKTAALIRAKLP